MDDDDLDYRRLAVEDKDADEVEWLSLDEYRQIFGVEYDPKDWSEEAFMP